VPASYRDMSSIVITGMGGSAIGGSLLQAYVAGECPLPIAVLRDYELPAYVGPKTLVIGSSHSGNTEETLAACQAAAERGARLLAITRGGKLAGMVEAAGGSVWRFEHGGQPRSAVGFSMMLALGALAKLGFVADKSAEVAAAVAAMREQQTAFRAETPVIRNPAKRLAGQIMDRLPLIFGSGYLAPVARRWKGQINEVGKALAATDELPEMDHNAVVGTVYAESVVAKSIAIFLRSSFDHPRNQLRADVTRQIYMTGGFNTDAIEAVGPNPLAHMLTALHYGDYMSFYLAICYGTDPSPIPQIDFLKGELAKR
jgi:glucose/mannose-6-phosphate isomerase